MLLPLVLQRGCGPLSEGLEGLQAQGLGSSLASKLGHTLGGGMESKDTYRLLCLHNGLTTQHSLSLLPTLRTVLSGFRKSQPHLQLRNGGGLD